MSTPKTRPNGRTPAHVRIHPKTPLPQSNGRLKKKPSIHAQTPTHEPFEPVKLHDRSRTHTFKTRQKHTKSFDEHKQDPDRYFDLNLKIRQQQFTIETLRNDLQKATEKNTESHTSENHYKKLIANFKKNEEKWLKQQRKKANKTQLIKYVFTDDISKIVIHKSNAMQHNTKMYTKNGNKFRLVNTADDIEIQMIDESDTIDEDDIVILCLNELRARIKDFKAREETNHYKAIKERYDKLPIYSVNDRFLKRLKSNNNAWITLFKNERKIVSKVFNKSAISNSFFSAMNQIKTGKQPTICIQNNIVLNNINTSQTQSAVIDSEYIQNKISQKDDVKWDLDSKNEEKDEDLDSLQPLGIMNGWMTAQFEMKEYHKQPSICIKNNILLNNFQNNSQKKPVINAAYLQNMITETCNANFAQLGHSKIIAIDSDDELEEKKEQKTDFVHSPNNVRNPNTKWYYLDKQRNKFIHSIAIPDKDSNEYKLLSQIGLYLNRLIPQSAYFDIIKDFGYMPINEANVADMMALCFDGILLSILINFVDTDLIDVRALHLPINGYPISKEKVIENMYVVKLCLTSLDLHQFPDFGIDFEVKKYDSDIELFCWFNPKQTVSIFLLIVMYQFMGMSNRKINVHNYPELFRLCQERNEKKTAQKTSCKEWLTRWIAYIKKPKIKKPKTPNGALKLKKHELFSSIDLGPRYNNSSSDVSSYYNDYDYDPSVNHFTDIRLIREQLNVSTHNIDTIIKGDSDIQSNYLLQFLYLSDLFAYNNLITKLSTHENKSVMDFLRKKEEIDFELIAWINSFKIVDEDGTFQYCENLTDNVSDGVILLRLLDICKQPKGVVNWSKIRTTNNIRHKFDKLANCNILCQICEDSFKDIFHLIGMGGNDIVDMNKKYIRGLLSQIQRYHSTKLFAKILFKKKAVTDEELLIWMNNRLRVYRQMVFSMNKMSNNRNVVKMKQNVKIVSFSDRSALTDCINFVNVVSSINPHWIQYKYINDETECKADNGNGNGNKSPKSNVSSVNESKLENAKYLITIMRRLACDNIFVSAKDLVRCEHRAVLAISAAIMTTAARYNEYDQLALFAKTLNQIKAKMNKTETHRL